MWTLVSALLLIWLLGWFAVLIYYRSVLWPLWPEPVLKHPVLIIESDDWGVGPTEQAKALTALADHLTEYRDANGNHPVVTLGMVLGEPDFKKMYHSDFQEYQRSGLDKPKYVQVLSAIHEGVEKGVFSLQLHGMEHYWPPSLMAAIPKNAKLTSWFASDGNAGTEELPAPLQSRWIDASVLPSRPLSKDEIDDAVADEVEEFKRIFGNIPAVVVPPTFIWTEAVERAWADQGIEVVVTPGRRYESRDSQGRPSASGGPIYNGQTTVGNMSYVVRDDYFEPSLGYQAKDALSALENKAYLGRPALLEMHRFNFVGDNLMANTAFAQLGELLQSAMVQFPDIRFMSTAQLAQKIRSGDNELNHSQFLIRLHYWLRRAGAISRLRKLAWLSGAIVPVWLVYRLSLPRGSTAGE